MKFYLDLNPTIDDNGSLDAKRQQVEKIVHKEFQKSGINIERNEEKVTYLSLYIASIKIGMSYTYKKILNSKYPVFLNFEKFLHIAFRHSKVFAIGSNNLNKSRFQYQLSDIERVIYHVLTSIEDDLIAHFDKHPNTRYSRSGMEKVRFNGDYFEFHINPNGLIETFYNHE